MTTVLLATQQRKEPALCAGTRAVHRRLDHFTRAGCCHLDGWSDRRALATLEWSTGLNLSAQKWQPFQPMETHMTKLKYLVLGLLVVSGAALIGAVAPGARGTATPGQNAMDIPALERTIDVKALSKRDLDPATYK